MKTLTTLTAVAALIAGMSIANIASAQNAAGPSPSTSSPSNLNKGGDTGTTAGQSGTQTKGAAMKNGAKKSMATGRSKFCMSGADGTNQLNCKYASMAACEKAAKPMNRNCQANPKMATTGMKSGSKSKMK